MKRNDTTFKAMVSRIQSGDLTRAQAAAEYNLKLGTLNTWLQRSKLAESTRSNFGADKPRYGAALDWGVTDPDKVSAIARLSKEVALGRISGRSAAIEAGVSAMTISRAAAKIRSELGLPPARPGRKSVTPPDPQVVKAQDANS